MKKVKTDITLPITIWYETIKSDGDGWNNPYVPAHIEICDIKFHDDDKRIYKIDELSNYIMRNWPEKLLEECKENETYS